MEINVETQRAQHAQANPDDMRTWYFLKPLLFDYNCEDFPTFVFYFKKKHVFSRWIIKSQFQYRQKTNVYVDTEWDSSRRAKCGEVNLT